MKRLQPLLWISLLVAVAGCASHPGRTLPTQTPPETSGANVGRAQTAVEADSNASLRPSGFDLCEVSEAAGLEIDDIPDLSDSLAAVTQALLPPHELFDYPVVVNRRVLTWVDHFTGKGREGFNRSLIRSGRFLPLARRVFAEEGVPQDLAFLAHIESGFRPDARSRAQAVGLWQFMAGTGRMYDLRCDQHVDERLDPVRSTRACARHLRDLHERYDDWYLALAAYNAGAGRVDRAVRNSGSRDFWTIASSGNLVNETRNFVPAILAATILAKSPAAYGLTEEAEPPLEYESVWVDSPTDLRVVARCVGRPVSEIEALNPALHRGQTPPGVARYEVFVPPGTGVAFAEAFRRIPKEDRLVFHHHKVGSGETLGLLARRYRTTVGAIQEANGLGRRTLIRVGQELRIPSSGTPLALQGSDGPTRHTVRRGQTLAGIARTYRVPLRTLQEANGIRDPSRIQAGQVLRIPGSGSPVAGDPGRAPASAHAALAASMPAAPTGPDGPAAAASAADPPMRVSDEDLGRGPSTAHLVEQARRQIDAMPPEPARPASPGRTTVHVVRKGDTLSGIARTHGVSPADLQRWNRLGSSSLIRPGQRLRLGASTDLASAGAASEGRRHIVQPGDTLWSISRRYGVPVSDLSRRNGLGRDSRIHPGQTLIVR